MPTESKSSDHRRSGHDRREAMRTGALLLARHGYAGLGMSLLLSELGMLRGSFYHHYGSKDAFVREVITWYGESVQRILAQQAQRQLPPLERLRKAYDQLLEWHTSDPGRWGCTIGVLLAEADHLDRSLALAADRQVGKWTATIAQALAEAQTRKEARRDYAATELANHLHTLYLGALMRYRPGHDAAGVELSLRLALQNLTGQM